MTYDIIILGSGPAGLTAALYGARANKSTLVLGGDSLGGQMDEIAKLENYPGWAGSGTELAEFMKKQAESFGAEFKMEHCVYIENKKDGSWEVRTQKQNYEAKSVIIATGASPRKLEIAGTKEFLGKGVSYCATCDGFFYSGKTVAVYGGGNSALNDALYLANIAKKVYIIYRKSSFTRAEAILVKRALETKNIECVFDTEISEVIGNESGMNGIKTNHGNEIESDGLFVAIGHEANTDFLPEDYDRDHLGRLLTDPNSARIVDGLFAAGDVRHTGKMQICTATGWGCEAAMDAIMYLNKIEKI
ncbi:MAG: FAD-dependent oxidoreductase [Rickettsiales bacterium]|jgi:thioredoxin reductase (NADPH)|nr:FAD-dependent oxidoreductase [Rickettsiales bacterium]